ncbi:MAG: methyltransferase domain-containing protein [Bacteroidota bacterium]|nr:methyltransferase domain-containing protein [Bacteroidota bacterium]
MRPETLLRWLQERSVKAVQSLYVPTCVQVERLPYPLLREVLENGWASIQDVSSVLVVELAAAQPGMQIIDLCGAPGGKACAVAERLHGQGQIAVVDIHPRRLQLAEREAQRLGVATLMSFHVADARRFRYELADIVLLDAPCSGLGTIAKKPDIKWRRRKEDIAPLVQLQRDILHNAAQLVRPGGVLLYSTCTIEPEENQEVVWDFLQRHPEFVLEEADRWLPAVVCCDGFLQTLPHRHERNVTERSRHGCAGEL